MLKEVNMLKNYTFILLSMVILNNAVYCSNQNVNNENNNIINYFNPEFILSKLINNGYIDDDHKYMRKYYEKSNNYITKKRISRTIKG